MMRLRFWGPIIVTLAIGGISLGRTEAQSSSVPALTGRVSSQEEGAMEGVLVSAKRTGSKVTVTVISNQQGQYSFPAARLEPGQYSLRIRAVGYELEDPRPVEVNAQTSTTLDLKLRKTQDVSRQLSNGEWLMSMTGTEEQKQNFLGCTTCHTLERIVRSQHDAVADSQGNIWYSDFGSQFLGKLDAKTGKIVEYPVPLMHSEEPKGALDIGVDPEGKIWMGMMYQGVIARFDPNTQKFDSWKSPKFGQGDAARTAMVTPTRLNVDGKVWVGADDEYQIDLKTGQWTAIDYKRDIPKDSPLAKLNFGSYGVAVDSKNNFYGMNLGGEFVTRVDAKTMTATPFRTPTPNSGPRRGHMDDQDRLWFAEFRGNKLGMFDTKTEKFTEYAIPTPWTNPYDAVLDKTGYAWTGGMSNDHIARVNTKTGEITEYLLPRMTNVRRVNVDNSTNPPTFWVGNNLGASIIKVEPLQP